MAERRLIVDQLKITYEGPFDLAGLYNLMDNFFYDKGFDKCEKLNIEQVLPTGRSVKIELWPWKSITDYFKIEVRTRILAEGVKNIEVDKDGVKLPANEGKLMVTIDGYLILDRLDQWKDTPFQWFIRIMLDKYIFKNHYMKAERWLISDIEDYISKIKSFLNVYRVSPERDAYTGHIL